MIVGVALLCLLFQLLRQLGRRRLGAERGRECEHEETSGTRGRASERGAH